MSHLLIFFTVQPDIRIGDLWDLGCSFHSGFAVVGAKVMKNLSPVKLVAHQQHFQLFDVVD